MIRDNVPARIGAEFYDPANPLPRALARGVFAVLTYRSAPDAFEELRRDALPIFTAAAALVESEKGPGARLTSALLLDPAPELAWWSEYTASEGVSPGLAVMHTRMKATEAFQAVFLPWCERWRWNEDWQRRGAIVALENWRAGLDDPFGVMRGPFGHGGFAKFSAEERRFAFQHPGWNPEWDTWPRAEAEIRRAFEARLAEYRAELEAKAEARGLVRSPRKEGRTPQDRARHIEWLVRWHVQAWSWTQIAREYMVTPDTARDGVRAAAELIGLEELRKGRAGRPRKRAAPA